MKHKTYIEIEVEIDYDFQPEEPAVLWPNDSAYPGCEAEVTINSVMCGNTDIREDLKEVFIFDQLQEIANEILEQINTERDER